MNSKSHYMSSGATFVPLLHGQLAELKKLSGSLFHRTVRDSIAETENYFQKLNIKKDKIDLRTALEPFFKAILDDQKLYQPIVLDCFCKVFHEATMEFFPDQQLTLDIINILIHADPASSDEVNLRCCSVCIACLRSYSGIHYAHGRLLRKMFRLLFNIYNSSENANTFNTIKTSIHETLLALYSAYESPPEIPHAKDIADLSARVTNTLVMNAVSTYSLLEPVLHEGDYTPTIRQVDVFVVLTLLARIIEKNKMKLRTIQLAADFIVFALKLESPFYETSAFRLLLQTNVHVAVLSLSLDSRLQLVTQTSELITILWKKFSNIYSENLNDVLVKGLYTTLTSPDQNVLLRALKVYAGLINNTQFLVDSYINYDCDQSGYFQNVFENTINQIVKLSFPDMKQTNVQKQALDVVVTVLHALWTYFDHFQITENVEPEAPQNFLEAKKNKDFFVQGNEIFKKSAKKGLQFFIDHNFAEDTPESISTFFFNTPALDPTSIGEVLGTSGERNQAILKNFASQFDFKGLSFEQAFRQFLSKFQIPGEAQMIDRVMEQFGTKYYNDNPNLFSCADTVYVLAFSALMLHTDAHHPNVKSRMTLDQFLRNNKGIDGGKDIPEEFLKDLYNGICSKKIFVSSSAASMPSSSLLTLQQRADLYKSQCQDTITQARGRSDSYQTRQFHRSESPLFIGPMFTTIWGSCLATLTMTFEQSDNRDIYLSCLAGLADAVHIASHCYIEDALDTLVDSFTKFTGLRRNLNEVKAKNYDCTIALLKIANEDGNFLRNAWEMVISEVSALEKLQSQTSYNNLNTVYQFEEIENIKESIFENSDKLDRESIVDFIKAMCKVSSVELSHGRIFLHQKLSVVAHFNMTRPRFIWTTIWDIIKKHLIKHGNSNKLEYSILSIDIIRQLSKKFLNQQELTNYHFQSHFLQPFFVIIEKQPSVQAKLLILDSIFGLIKEMGNNIQSGWSVIFQILTFSSKFLETQQRGFDVITYIVKSKINLVSEPSNLLEINIIVKSFIEFASEEIAKEAVQYFESIAALMPISETEKWYDILTSITTAAQNQYRDVRHLAHSVLLNICKSLFDNETQIAIKFWQVLITENLTDFFNYGEQSADFLTVVFEQLIHPHWEIFSLFFKDVIRLLRKSLFNHDSKISACAISTLNKYVKDTFDQYDDEKQDFLLSQLIEMSKDIFNLTLHNGKAFITMVDELSELSCQNHQISSRFIDSLYEINNACENSDNSHLHLIWGFQRTTITKDLIRIKENKADEIIDCFYYTFAKFLEYVHDKNIEGDSLAAWNDAAILSLKILNEIDYELFVKCFEKSTALIIKLVTTKNKEVRTEVATCLNRKLIPQ